MRLEGTWMATYRIANRAWAKAKLLAMPSLAEPRRDYSALDEQAKRAGDFRRSGFLA